MFEPITITVFGKAQPAGSKRAFRHRATDKVVVTDSNPKAKSWKNEVAATAGIQYLGPLLDVPLSVEMTFYEVRPKGHYGTGRNEGIVKDSAPVYPCGRPDVLKLARGVEDALTGVVWRDDSRIVDEYLAKRYGDRARVEIRITPVETARVDELVARGEIEPLGAKERFEQMSLPLAA